MMEKFLEHWLEHVLCLATAFWFSVLALYFIMEVRPKDHTTNYYEAAEVRRCLGEEFSYRCAVKLTNGSVVSVSGFVVEGQTIGRTCYTQNDKRWCNHYKPL